MLEKACRKYGTTLEGARKTYNRICLTAPIATVIHQMKANEFARKLNLDSIREMLSTWKNLIGIPKANETLFQTEEYIISEAEMAWGNDVALFFSRETGEITAAHPLREKPLIIRED